MTGGGIVRRLNHAIQTMVRRGVAAAALALLLGGAGPVIGLAPAVMDHLPGVALHDRRQMVDADQSPWRGLARVQTDLGERCSGFLVAPDTVLTASHCLYRRATGGWVQPGSVHVLLGYQQGRFAAHELVRSYVRGASDPGAGGASAGADWAVLTLARPITVAGRIMPTGPIGGGGLRLAGYGQDRAEQLVGDPGCHLLGEAHDADGRLLLRHDCAATNGTSGAPVLQQGTDGVWRAIAIQIAASRDGVGGYAVPLGTLPRDWGP
jgi:protease YdgD